MFKSHNVITLLLSAFLLALAAPLLAQEPTSNIFVRIESDSSGVPYVLMDGSTLMGEKDKGIWHSSILVLPDADNYVEAQVVGVGREMATLADATVYAIVHLSIVNDEPNGKSTWHFYGQPALLVIDEKGFFRKTAYIQLYVPMKDSDVYQLLVDRAAISFNTGLLLLGASLYYYKPLVKDSEALSKPALTLGKQLGDKYMLELTISNVGQGLVKFALKRTAVQIQAGIKF